MSNIEKIRQEIERRQEYHWKYLPDADSPEDDWTHNELCELGAFEELEHLEGFIDSLPEEDTTEDLNELIQKWDRIDINTVLKVKVKATGKVIDGFYDGMGHFDHFIDHDVFDRYSIDEVELMPEEKPSEDLEEAAEKYRRESLKKSVIPQIDGPVSEYIGSIKGAFIAGAEWQKEQDAARRK